MVFLCRANHVVWPKIRVERRRGALAASRAERRSVDIAMGRQQGKDDIDVVIVSPRKMTH